MAELSAQRGQYDDAAQELLSLARDTLDPRLARRAFQMSMTGRNLALALRSAREWAALDPSNPEAVAASLALSASSGQTEGLARTLSRRIASADDQDQAIVQAAGIVSKMTDKRLALDVLDKALAGVAGTSALARLALADAAWAAGEPVRAVDEARRAQALDPDSQDAAQRVLEYGLRVEPIRAIKDTYAYLDGHPDRRGLQLLLVSRLTGRGSFDEALGLLDRCAAAPRKTSTCSTPRPRSMPGPAATMPPSPCWTSTSRSSSSGARPCATTPPTPRPTCPTRGCCWCRSPSARTTCARPSANCASIDEPSLLFQARTHEAVLYGKLGDLKRARTILDAIKPADRRERAVVRLTLASIYRDAGRTDQAVELLKASDLEMPDTPEIKYDLGMLLHQQGKTAEFETLMRRVIELDPDNANAYNSLGYTFVEQNRKLDEARDLLERALELDPDSAYILDSVGWYLFRIRDYQGALEYLRRSYDRMPAADVAAHLGETLWALGRHDEARRIWAEGRKTDPDSAALKETLQRLGVELP